MEKDVECFFGGGEWRLSVSWSDVGWGRRLKGECKNECSGSGSGWGFGGVWLVEKCGVVEDKDDGGK